MRSAKAVRWATGISIVAISIATPTIATAQTTSAAFRIPAGDLDNALRIYASTTGIQILYKPQDVRNRRFPGLQATMGAEAALALILRGSGLVIERPSPKVVVVRRGITGAVPAVDMSNAGIESSPTIVVTGSNIRGGDASGPVRTLGRRDFERSGKATIADLIAAQTANFGGSGNPVASLTGIDQASLNYSLAPAANLRGLGSDATLTLFDGRRVAGSGGRGDFTDLSAIPSLAVDRVEILTDGASAIYGSDAIAGVVNLILRHRFDGVEFRLRGGVATRGEPWNGLGSAAAGHTWSSGSIFAAYEYEHRERLSSADRPYTATGDLRAFGGSDRRGFYSAPGNILRFNPAIGAYTSAYAIPALSRQPTLADIQPGQNPGNRYALSDLSPRIDRHAVYGRAEQAFGNLDLFVEGRFSKRSFDYASPASANILSISAANPFYIPVAGQASTLIGYSFIGDLGPARVDGHVSALSVTGGADWQVGGWTIDGYGSFARERSGDLSYNQVNTTALAEALGNSSDSPLTTYSAARDGYFNPYGSGASNTAATLAFIGAGYARAARRSSLTEGAAKAEGPLFTLPGGDMRLAIGGSYRRETFVSTGESFYSGIVPAPTIGNPGHREIEAGFAELRIPLIGEANASPGLRRLVFSAALRHESYDDFGATTNPKLGLIYSPATGITLRGSYGTSFRAPALTEVNDATRVVGTALPNASGTVIPVIFLIGGNSDLGPEKAETFSGGAVIEPAGIPGLRWEMNVFKTRFDNRISQPALEDFARALSNPALATFARLVSPATNAADLAAVMALLTQPGASVGSTPATQYGAIVDGRFVNTSALDVTGLDWDLSLSRPIGSGRIDTSISATWLFHYRQKLTPLSSTIDRLDTLGNPVNLRLRASAGWSKGPVSATFIGNYVDGYNDDISTPARRIASFFTLDATLGLAPTGGILRGYRLSLAIDNLLNADPPFVNRVNGFGFDAGSANPVGRSVAVEVRRAW